MCSPSESAICRTLVVTAELLAVRELALFLREVCAEAQVGDCEVLDLELAMVEAATNVVEHGYSDREGGAVALQVCVRPGGVTLTLTDTGKPAPEGVFSNRTALDMAALSGRGISIIQACVDGVEYTSRAGCNRLTLHKTLSG